METFSIEQLSPLFNTQLWSRTAESYTIDSITVHGRRVIVKKVSEGSPQTCRLERDRINSLAMMKDGIECIPRIIAATGTMLVVEEVGEGLQWRDDALWLGGRLLSENEKRDVCEKACEALRDIHRKGWTYGNVELRHCRVEWRGEWKVWWVDLCCARRGTGGWDLIECREVFDGRGDKDVSDWVTLSRLLHGYRDLRLPHFVEVIDDSDDELAENSSDEENDEGEGIGFNENWIYHLAN